MVVSEEFKKRREQQKKAKTEFEKQQQDKERASQIKERGIEKPKDDVIRLGKPKKTGLEAMREEDTIIGNLVRAATDWRTTVALVATLGTLGMGAAVLGGSSGVGTAVAVGTRQVFSRGGSSVITRTVGGKITEQFLAGKFASGILGSTATAKSVALTTSLLTKSGMMVGVAAGVATIAGTYPFAHFELAEATDKIGIAMFRASQEGDTEKVEELALYLEEMLNPTAWDKVVNKIPFANVFNSVSKNIAAAKKSAEVFTYLAQKEAERIASGETEADMWAGIRQKQEDYDANKRLETEEYYKRVEENIQQAKKDERKEDEKYWDKIARDKEKNAKRERDLTEEYYAAIRIANEKAKQQERDDDAAYWAGIRKSTTGTPGSQLSFGLLRS